MLRRTSFRYFSLPCCRDRQDIIPDIDFYIIRSTPGISAIRVVHPVFEDINQGFMDLLDHRSPVFLSLRILRRAPLDGVILPPRPVFRLKP